MRSIEWSMFVNERASGITHEQNLAGARAGQTATERFPAKTMRGTDTQFRFYPPSTPVTPCVRAAVFAAVGLDRSLITMLCSTNRELWQPANEWVCERLAGHDEPDVRTTAARWLDLLASPAPLNYVLRAAFEG